MKTLIGTYLRVRLQGASLRYFINSTIIHLFKEVSAVKVWAVYLAPSML